MLKTNKILKFLTGAILFIAAAVIFFLSTAPLFSFSPDDYYARGLLGATLLSQFAIFLTLTAAIPLFSFAAYFFSRYPNLKWLWPTIIILHLIFSAVVIFILELGLSFSCFVCRGWRGAAVFILPILFAALLFLFLRKNLVGRWPKLERFWWAAIWGYAALSAAVIMPSKITGLTASLIFGIFFRVLNYELVFLTYFVYVAFLNLIFFIILLKWFVQWLKERLKANS